MLNGLILKTNNSPELTFDLQVGDSKSVPDATISQMSMKIVVETKLYNQFEQIQLENHLSKFTNEDIKVLLTLDPKPMNQSTKNKFEEHLAVYNRELIRHGNTRIEHVNLTFEQLVSAMEDIVDNSDFEILSVLEDYKNYCSEERLIPDDDKWMRAIAAGTTIEENMQFNMYYDHASHGYSPHGYIGLYKDKKVQAIGKLVKTVLAEYKNEEFEFISEDGNDITNNEIENIKTMIQKAEDEHGYNIKFVQHRFYC